MPAASWLCYGLNDWVLLRERIAEGQTDETQKQIEMQKLDAMLSVCETADCRRVLLLRHFGENSQPCGHCDNCLYPPVRFNGTVLAQKLLSCVYRVGQRYAAGYVINVLRGKSDDWIRSNRHHELSTYGIGGDLSDKEWRSVIRQCISAGYLTVNPLLHQSLQLTENAKQVLKGGSEVWFRPLKREKAATQKPKEEWLRTEREERLWQALRSWRQQKAKADEVPAYVVCGDKTLRDIVEKMPQTLEELHEIYGLGEAKISKFGLEILNVCEAANQSGDRPSENRETVLDELDEREQQLQQALLQWREKQAQMENTTPHSICSDDSLQDLVRNTPEIEADLQGIYGLGEVRIGRYGANILAVCRPFSDGLDTKAWNKRLLMRRLLQWCTDIAKREGEPEYKIFSKITLRAIAAKQPVMFEELAAIHGMDGEKVAKYGKEILALCATEFGR